MKTYFLLILLLVPPFLKAQDWMVTMSNDTIKCKILQVEKSVILYQNKGESDLNYESTSELRGYFYDNSYVVLSNAPVQKKVIIPKDTTLQIIPTKQVTPARDTIKQIITQKEVITIKDTVKQVIPPKQAIVPKDTIKKEIPYQLFESPKDTIIPMNESKIFETPKDTVIPFKPTNPVVIPRETIKLEIAPKPVITPKDTTKKEIPYQLFESPKDSIIPVKPNNPVIIPNETVRQEIAPKPITIPKDTIKQMSIPTQEISSKDTSKNKLLFQELNHPKDSLNPSHPGWDWIYTTKNELIYCEIIRITRSRIIFYKPGNEQKYFIRLKEVNNYFYENQIHRSDKITENKVVKDTNIEFEKKPIYEEVVKVDSVKKDLLYERALRWLLKYCINNNALQIKDKERGELFGHFTLHYNLITKGHIDDLLNYPHTIPTNVTLNISAQIICKDNRYKYKFEIVDVSKNIITSQYSRTQRTDKLIDYQIDDNNEFKINKLIRSLKTGMKLKTDFEKPNEW